MFLVLSNIIGLNDMYGPGLIIMEELAGLVAIDLFTTLQARVSPGLSQAVSASGAVTKI